MILPEFRHDGERELRDGHAADHLHEVVQYLDESEMTTRRPRESKDRQQLPLHIAKLGSDPLQFILRAQTLTEQIRLRVEAALSRLAADSPNA